jgi:hypothetical protein
VLVPSAGVSALLASVMTELSVPNLSLTVEVLERSRNAITARRMVSYGTLSVEKASITLDVAFALPTALVE